jgi:hypothetical protein
VGVTEISLTATNSLDLTATASVMVTVTEGLDQPGPTLTAGPAQIGWNVGVGESQVQMAELDIGNSGSGDLEFTAESSAPWLTLSAAAGTAPATLTLTADPVGFAGGVTEEANVTLTAVGIPGQVITVPVTLSVGDTFSRTIHPSSTTSTTPSTAPSTTSTTVGTTSSTTAPTTPTSTSTTQTSSTTTTTLPRCATLRCIIDAARHAPSCGDEALPARISKKLDLAIVRAELAQSRTPKKAKRLYKSVSHLLAKAGKAATKAAGGRRPTLSTECAADLLNAIREAGALAGSRT